MDTSAILFAFGLTLSGGLSTGIGSTLAFLTKKTNTDSLSLALRFSAGVMIYVSFVEIFVEARDVLIQQLGNAMGYRVTVLSFFAGMVIMALSLLLFE